MEIKNTIVKLLQHKGKITTQEAMAALRNNYSRQYISRTLKMLVEEGRAVKIGQTAGAFYIVPEKQEEIKEFLGKKIKLRLQNEDLKEHEVLSKINNRLPFIIKAKENIRSIFDYAFSEMVNNAIEHSQSKFIEIEVVKEDESLCFIVNDFGIGAYRNVMKKRGLKSELEAMQDLLKGKTTTEPRAHSGEGIFFTSKAADEFFLDSFEHRLRVDNTVPDVFFEKVKPLKRGTRVVFRISLQSKRHLSDVFNYYSSDPNEPAFDKTKIQVKLFTMETICVSRSQARRIMVGLDAFKIIELDYDKVPTIGPAFADEIYRVFQNKYPAIQINSINTNEAVSFMINRVAKNKG